MNTPIYDFVRQYAKSGVSRLHMPGHKGTGMLGVEALDITEISGADSMYEAEGIIAQSEQNASALFDTGATFYSTEGSSQCIRAMLYLALLHWRERYADRVAENTVKREGMSVGAPSTRPVVVAARNAHKAFLVAAALLDFDIVWLWSEKQEMGEQNSKEEKVSVVPYDDGSCNSQRAKQTENAGQGLHSICACTVTEEQLRHTLGGLSVPPAAVYLTSPDYLGGQLDIAVLAEVAHEAGTLLLVDDAHGAYQHFLPVSKHPMDLGADICCDSAHKTLPVLTGGAYLHIARTAPQKLIGEARQALALFGSTSPSYLIMQSLDLANRYLAEGYRERLAECVAALDELKERLKEYGWQFVASDPLKLTIAAAECGYTGTELAAALRREKIECEYADPDFLVLMLTPENSAEDMERLYQCLAKRPVREAVAHTIPGMQPPEVVCTVREATFAPHEWISVGAGAIGRVLAAATVHCPPAIPVVVSGERIGEDAVRVLEYYGIEEVCVVR
ncbi:MAG: amino acid decarboxylase [Lachnospiraceae bacterium]|nr:amino acid decarboxylase [Lachnospiraceae bacterium]